MTYADGYLAWADAILRRRLLVVGIEISCCSDLIILDWVIKNVVYVNIRYVANKSTHCVVFVLASSEIHSKFVKVKFCKF
jgi:hypothetical protein